MITKVGLSAGRSQGCAKRQGGFTLIELSIVLTIIGLIVGGVLKGQELINNARIKAQMAQIDRIKSGVLTFQDRYNFLPGDDPNITSILAFTNAAGDGNGAIAAPAAISLTDSLGVTGTESITAWAHLAAANLLAGYVLPTNTALTAVNGNSVQANVPGKITGTQLWLASFSSAVTGQTNLAVRMQIETQGVAPLTGLREADMQGLDTKYDDGLPFSGSIWIADAGTTGNCATSAAVASTYVSPPATPTAPSCIPMFGVQ